MGRLELGELGKGIVDSLDKREVVKRDSEPRKVEHLRHQASISESNLIANAVLALGGL